jgi:hypothetical protein
MVQNYESNQIKKSKNAYINFIIRVLYKYFKN